jgi:hypothetical protein
MVVTKQVNSQLEWLSSLSTSFNAMGEDEKFLRKVSLGPSLLSDLAVRDLARAFVATCVNGISLRETRVYLA